MHLFGSYDPDPHQSERQDPDPKVFLLVQILRNKVQFSNEIVDKTDPSSNGMGKKADWGLPNIWLG
jgi:hypothetical protein